MAMSNELEREASHPLDQYINNQTGQSNTVVEDFEHQFTEKDQQKSIKLASKLNR